MTLPEVHDVLGRVGGRIARKQRREVELYQAACLFALARPFNHEGMRVLEIGTAVGYSAAILAEAAPMAEIITLNPDLAEAQIAEVNLRPYQNVSVIRRKSWEYLAEQRSGSPFHFIFIDGDHKRVRLDLPFWNLLAEGGLMLFHDYSPEGTWRACPPVYAAANDFAIEIQPPDVLIVDDRGVGMIGFSKRSDSPPWRDFGAELALASESSDLPVTRLDKLARLATKVTAEGIVADVGAGRGGVGCLMAKVSYREVALIDNFEGQAVPDERDGEKALNLQGKTYRISTWDEARATFGGFQIPGGVYVADVLDPDANLPDDPIAILHLDLDYYAPTLAALERLYEQVMPGGLIICDDYGHWQGAMAAVDGFRAERGITAPMEAIDYTSHYWRKE